MRFSSFDIEVDEFSDTVMKIPGTELALELFTGTIVICP